MRDETAYIPGGPADWYKDAIIYQLHVKAFQDGDGDGMGDFAGLISRLDYIEELGVDTIWLLPFYPSPLRDDGYDIADYESVHPSYGDMETFRAFVEEAHRRGLRVVTELVINHTSDQHPWFQRARRAPPGSVERDFYVWSDDDRKWPETRIIFLDTESSNWSWDPVAGAYYWHRFYHHQPDLNFDNPAVMDEVLRVMKFWLDIGVDGLRLDAIPYLVERDGTNNENLPETHDVLKRIRAELDAHCTGRMLLAEANQWPEDTRPYFGDGDECHMGFHFPLMPRMYMALAQEDRYAITDILRQTPPIPENCQWAIFLRNHDELTLEMVTEKERDFLWSVYASDKRARINLGIRRRLAPLLDNDRRKIELMNALLFSMPGTPVIYYGDEIGMGDNFYLGDRDGVRTPMQWSPDRNGGFSRAKPQALFLPAIQDPVYGFEAVNVEAQSGAPGSLLNWMRRMVRIRRRIHAFGRGTLTFVYPRNRKILAYIRSYGDEDVLCVFNISRSAQAAELDLHAFRGRVPIELEGGSAFPPIGELNYLLTLPPWGFYWFQLARDAALPDWHEPVTGVQPEFETIPCRSERIEASLTPDALDRLSKGPLPEFLRLQYWFPHGASEIEHVAPQPGPELRPGVNLATVYVRARGHETERWFLPLVALWGEEHLQFGATTLSATIARLRRANRLGALIDGCALPGFAIDLFHAMREDRETQGPEETLRASSETALKEMAAPEEARLIGALEGNLAIGLDGRAVVKIYRNAHPGMRSEVEIARFLHEQQRFHNTPEYFGEASLVDGDGRTTTIAACFSYVRGQGDARTVMVDALARALEDRVHAGEDADRDAFGAFAWPLDLGEVMGRRLGELHEALADDCGDPAFRPEPVAEADVARWSAAARVNAGRALAALATTSEEPDRDRLLGLGDRALDAASALAGRVHGGLKTRVHGDMRIGRFLVAENDVFITGFARPRMNSADGGALSSPLDDLAGALASLDNAVLLAMGRFGAKGGDVDAAESEAEAWRRDARASLLEGYAAARGLTGVADDPLFALFLLDRAFSRVRVEAEAGRPVRLAARFAVEAMASLTASAET